MAESKRSSLRKSQLIVRKATPGEKEALYMAFAGLAAGHDVEALMADLCTPREIDELAQRLNIAKMLNQGNNYLDIQDKTGASATTIARVSKCLANGKGGYQMVIGRPRGRREPPTDPFAYEQEDY
ncbi:MAG: YerC/YecD family TrpR-related protein [Coriobacteriia bacterium]|nr:YerC/YecD family TrpR-related protein [Coriobacteriia bacterium]